MPGLSIKEHGFHFIEFCELEKELKGPDPQLATLNAMCQLDGADIEEIAWRAGVMVGVWNVPTAEMIWKNWPILRTLVHTNDDQLETWLRDNWAGIFTRRERRCVRTPEKMAKYLNDYATWVYQKLFRIDPSYEAYWDNVQAEVKFMGRYVTLKLLEFIRAYMGLPIECPDIRAAGGWSPVRAMALYLFEDLQEHLSMARNSAEAVQIAEAYAAAAKERVCQDVEINFFELQVMLCEYRTGYEHSHQYPGRSLDEELEFATKAYQYWDPIDSSFWEARARTFDTRALGEFHGWDKIRKELGTCLPHHGYLWSDLRYIYQETENLAQPVRRT